MDTFKSPLTSAATFPLTHGTPGTPGPRSNDPISEEPFSAHGRSRRHVRRTTGEYTIDAQDSTRRARLALTSDGAVSGSGAKQPKHKHSKSRELRFSRPMSHLASSASARGLLPTWSKEKEREGDDGLLRPVTQETTRSRWGSESTSRSRKGSLLDAPEQHERLGPIRRQEIQSMDDLEKVKKRRKQGEECLRSALSSIGSIATEATRRLDYTYYNLLEKVTALNSTIGSFQDLSDSAATLLSDFERETAGLDQEVRKQINDLKGFEPQIQKADALEERMKHGRKRVEELGSRLDAVRRQIDEWEQRESEWQSRVSRRLRIFWAAMGSAFLVLVLAIVIQNWPDIAAGDGDHCLPTEATNRSSLGASYQSDMWESAIEVDSPDSEVGPTRYPLSLEDRLQSLQQASTVTASTTRAGLLAAATDDPFRVLEEL